MRLYQPIWNRIKAAPDHKVTIEVRPEFFARVIKAVIKEKDIDLAIKVLNELEKPRLFITRDKEKGRLTFKLVQKLGIQELKTGT